VRGLSYETVGALLSADTIAAKAREMMVEYCMFTVVLVTRTR
jgi:hypothetical protein